MVDIESLLDEGDTISKRPKKDSSNEAKGFLNLIKGKSEDDDDEFEEYVK